MTASAWSPLRYPLFRALWIAAVVSNVGTWMQSVGGVWLMTSLTSSSLMVALMQTATSLPVLLVGLPSGALADIFDRRRLLLIWQGWMLTVAAILGVLTILGLMTPWLLLALTFALGLGAAMTAPAWQAIISELVPRADLPAAVALNGVGINLARAVGPAIGGLIVAAAGAGAVFLLNAVSFVGVLLVIYRWQRQPHKSALPAERLTGAMRAGVRYLNHSPALRAVLIRTAVLMSCSSALLALLPLVARQELGLGASGYGVLLGCVGAGAVLGAAILPQLRQRLSMNLLVTAATLVFAIATAVLAFFHSFVLVGMTLMAGGVAWISMMSSLNVAVQFSVASWVRARALGIYQLVFQGSIAIGSVIWGSLAERWGNSTALAIAAVGLLLGLLTAVRYRLSANERLDLSPSLHWAEPIVMVEIDPEDGPVLITIEYQIDPQQAQAFAAAMHHLSAVRRRDGAIRWGIFFDTADAGRYVETFVVESWAEHLRQHERFTVADREAESIVRAFHVGEKPPIVSHLIYAHNTPLREILR